MAASDSVGIDWLVAGARSDAPLAERVAWLDALVDWVRAGGRIEDSGAQAPATRIKFFLQVLGRHPDRRLEVAKVLRHTVRELDAVSLLCDTGLPRASAFFQELGNRVVAKVVPAPPTAPDLAALFHELFPEAEDADWVATLPQDVMAGLTELADFGDDPATDGAPVFARHAADALVILGSQVQAIGLSQRVRRRTAMERAIDSPFATLPATIMALVGAPAGSTEAAEARTELRSLIPRCQRALSNVGGHLENYGVSIDLVYQLERAQLSLQRMEVLLALDDDRDNDGQPDLTATAHFVAALIRANAAQSSVRALLRDNTRLLARRIVESARRTGEHYITHDRAAYRAMLLSAAIGGTITGATVLVKIASSGLPLPPFLFGLVASINYALSFVVIHLLHGTLATKQPAMTAATLAEQLNAPPGPDRLTGFVESVAELVRSQVAAIVGNLLLVVPAALLLQALLLGVGAGHVPSPDHALPYIESLSLWSAAPFYAACTGVLLWLSAVIAGWFENWATYRRLPEAIAQAPTLQRLLGAERAKGLAASIEQNVAALGGNISLGLLLGMVPVVAVFFGLPLEVRHVTLSTGQLALATWAQGGHILTQAVFWWAVVGIGVIGFMNLTVSFALALWVAIRSTGRGRVSRRRLRRAVLAHLRAAPRDFLLPPRERRD